MGERKICYGCMNRVEFTDGVCPLCGYSEKTPYDPFHIRPGVIVNTRYIVGVAEAANGEGITYISYDLRTGQRVWLREYAPRNLCSRMENSPQISVVPARLVQYKALMAQFTELHMYLAGFRGQITNISGVENLFAENNTTYVVYEYIEGVPLVDYLKDFAGELSWRQLSAMLPPLTTTLSLLHNSGITHRAISPETVLVRKDRGEFLLTGFCISAVRTANSELQSELYEGYAAPEQYAANLPQGSWTDVYGLCALLYRTLAGCMPTSAESRLQSDNLMAPETMNESVPHHVSRMIMQGMALESGDRIRTITELVIGLFDENAAEEETYKEPPAQEEEPYEEPYEGYTDDYAYEDYDSYTDYEGEERAGAIDRLKVPIIVGIVLLLGLMVAVFVLGRDFFDTDSSSAIEATTAATTAPAETTTQSDESAATATTTAATSTSTGDGIMPNLLGRVYKSNREQYSWIDFDVEEVYSDAYAAGLICWQEFEPGASFDTSEPVKIQVSRGAATVVIPAFSGYGVNTYCTMLDELGITYIQSAESTTGYFDGAVIRLTAMRNGVAVDIEPGATINLNDNYTFTVVYAYNPEPATTEAPTTETTAPAETVPEATETAPPATETPTETAAAQ